jgi:hypothetical protein
VNVRQHPRVRALARRHVGLLLRRARSWGNVDSALRLLGEDRRHPVAFGRCDDPLLDVLYWQPFVRWAREHFGLAKGADDAVTVPPDRVLALVEEYRRGEAPPRPLLKRTRYTRTGEQAEARNTTWSAEAVQAVLAGAPTIAILPADGAVEPDLDLALRVAAEIGGSLTILSTTHLARLLQALRGPEAELTRVNAVP